MESRAKLLGHAIHPMLVVFPLGLLATSLIFDVVYLVRGEELWGEIAYWMITVGVLGGLIAAVFGFIDWMAIPKGTRARAVGRWHGLGNLVVMGLFAASWGLRYDDRGSPEISAVVLSACGVVVAVVSAWLGGELVDRLGVGVDDGAHLNSPNSLSGRPASESAPPMGTAGRSPSAARPQ